jgi:hypothetical protein
VQLGAEHPAQVGAVDLVQHQHHGEVVLAVVASALGQPRQESGDVDVACALIRLCARIPDPPQRRPVEVEDPVRCVGLGVQLLELAADVQELLVEILRSALVRSRNSLRNASTISDLCVRLAIRSNSSGRRR